MAYNDNVVFKTSTTATIDDLFTWNKSTGQITAKTDNIPIVPGTVYFTSDGHIVHDLAQNNRLWMSKNAYSAIYAEDVAETNTDIANAIKYSIHYVEGPTTDTTPGTWTGTINGITELYDGLTIIYVPAVAGGSSTTTLNINGLGAKTCYYSNTSAMTTHYSVGTPILLTYRNNCWRRADYNSNTTYSAMSVAEMRAGTATSERSIRADYLKTFLSTLGGTNLTLTHSNSAPYLQLNHNPSGITAGTYGNNSQQTPSYGGTFNIPYFTVDAQGHITNASTTTVKIPESDNTDYKVRQTPINSNDNNNYRILLSNSANNTLEDSVSKKNANLIYNPTENKLSTGNIKLTGELDVTGNVYLRNQTAVDNLTAGSLIINGNSTFNNDINLAQGAVKWTSNSLPSVTSADYFLVIDAFANGGATKHITKANAIKSLISSSAIGSSTKPVYWTGNAFSAITSYSGAAALTGTPTAPTAAAGTNTTQIATTEFVTNAVAQGFVANDAMVFKGLIGSNQPITQLPTSGYNAGWTYRVANAGIFAGEYCEVGDLLIAINDGPASGSSVINTDWGKVEHNIDGAVFRGSGASNSSVGSSTQPVYVNGSGIVTAITSLGVEAGGTGENSRRKAGLFYNWTTSLQGQIWSRICYIPYTNHILGSTMILNIRHTRADVVYNETVIITAHYNSKGNITSLSSSNYNKNTTIQIRVLANPSGHCYIELKDSNKEITEGTAISPVYCTLQIITLGNTDEPTLKTSFEDGTVLPEDFSVAAEVTLGRNRIVTSGIFSGNLEGNADTATTATNATQLISNDCMDYGWNGINYFNISTSNQSAAKVNDTPFSSNVWTHILRFNHNNASGYYTDLAIPFSQNSIYYKRIAAGSLQNSTTNGGWIKVLDQLNYTSYTVTKTGSGASGTWNINISGNAATATALSSSGTTNQFWRGDNRWSDTLGFIKINNEIKIKGYGDNNNYWHSIKDLSTVPLTNDCWHYLPNTSGWIVTSPTNGTGNNTTPIYVDTRGVAKPVNALPVNQNLLTNTQYYFNNDTSTKPIKKISTQDIPMSDCYSKYDIASGTGVTDLNLGTFAPMPDTWYTLSFYARANYNNTTIRTHFYPNTMASSYNCQGFSTTAGDGPSDFTVSTEWKRYWVCYKTSASVSGTKNLIARLISGTSPGTTLRVALPKLEVGQIMTPWVPHANDFSQNKISTCYIDNHELNNYQWHRIATCSVGTTNYDDRDIILFVHKGYLANAFGILKISVRVDTNAVSPPIKLQAKWLLRHGFSESDCLIGLTRNLIDASSAATADIYFKTSTTYARIAFTALNNFNKRFTLFNSDEIAKTENGVKITDLANSTEVYIKENIMNGTTVESIKFKSDASSDTGITYVSWEYASDSLSEKSLIPIANNTYDLGSSSLKWNNIYANNFIGNAATATTAGGITSAGTTAQFWRGDNTWSNMLEQTTATTLGINTSDLRIGRAIRTLHIATSDNGTGAGITDGNAAGITFGVSNAAYAGIYYQSSGSYGSRLYFATTSSFGNGAYARMMITHDGKVGIHTTSPSTRLHVDGDVTITGLTASQAVATDANKKLISKDLTFSEPATSGTDSETDITYIAKISQNAVGKISATKRTMRSASTSQTGVLQFTAENTNAQLNTLTTGGSTPTDNDYYISQYADGGTTYTSYHRRPMSKLWNYVSGKITNGIYWGNVKTTSAATYKAQPEVASIKINGKTAAGDTDSVSTKNVQLVYDASLEVLNFVFS